MADAKSLPYIIELLDDESPVVQEEVARALAAFGDALPALISPLSLTPAQKVRLQQVLLPVLVGRIPPVWRAWNALPSSKVKLEQGLELIAGLMEFPLHTLSLATELDRLANDAATAGAGSSERELTVHLFSTLGFGGNRTRYYAAENSDMLAVIQTRTGLPITLACLLMLVAHRLRLNIEGSLVPGHFLASVATESGHSYIDCFNNGRWLPESALMEPPFNLPEDGILLARLPADAETIIARVLRNLMVAYAREQDEARQNLFAGLLTILQEHQPHQALTQAAFRPGDLVRDKEGQFRGVVVQVDPGCKADDTWYYTHKTQPDRNQPWYHILVDGSSSSTYAAQDELEADGGGRTVNHPLLSYFFGPFEEGRYPRNQRPWSEE